MRRRCDYVAAQVPAVWSEGGRTWPAGKGVLLCQTRDEALAALDTIMKTKRFGQAGNKVVVEEFLTAEEASFLVFTDGKTIKPLPLLPGPQGRVRRGDRGPIHRGHWGAYSPAPVVTPELQREVMERVMRPTVDGLAAEGARLQGRALRGLMIRSGRSQGSGNSTPASATRNAAIIDGAQERSGGRSGSHDRRPAG
jgi:phosphoribosylamine-glycine ligase